MPFIQATLENLDTPVSINVDQIIAVYEDNTLTFIHTNGTHGLHMVRESYSDIVKRIETAQVYGPKG